MHEYSRTALYCRNLYCNFSSRFALQYTLTISRALYSVAASAFPSLSLDTLTDSQIIRKKLAEWRRHSLRMHLRAAWAPSS